MQRTLFGYDSELNLNAKAHTTDNIISLADERLKVHKTEYDRAGRVLKLRNNQYQYDECGRLIEKTETKKGFRPQQTRYQWNADDQLMQVDLPNGERWRYQYDPFSRRISKTYCFRPRTGATLSVGWRPAHSKSAGGERRSSTANGIGL
ncbi:RHS repeat domain-containing protein [Celerinatantimonas sp. YJH-8]|uniref:RHS repeat domain-containing protein n=1 Tax=Celerinatantimonas sp. YJH-8 TaxID=3228714 RepID=UPI0038BF0ACB